MIWDRIGLSGDGYPKILKYGQLKVVFLMHPRFLDHITSDFDTSKI
jgi:hypothetical protein